MYGFYNDGVWGGSMMGWFGGGVMMLVFWVAIIFFVVWLVREVSGSDNRRQNRPEHHGKTALDILKERYAKAEIDTKEFEEKKRELSK